MRNRLNDFGLVFGIELGRPVMSGSFSLEARYFHGTKNLAYAGNVLRNRCLAALLGFTFDLWPRPRRLHN